MKRFFYMLVTVNKIIILVASVAAEVSVVGSFDRSLHAIFRH